MKQFTGTLFSFERGPVPINIMTLYCRGVYEAPGIFCVKNTHIHFTGCHTTYRPNYYVTSADRTDSRRVYYGGIPQYIEAAESFYFDSILIEHFRYQMALSQCVHHV